MNIKFTQKEKILIKFLYKHRLYSENELEENESVKYLNSINSNYFKMFESSQLYHSDDRLTNKETKIIGNIYNKINLYNK